MLSNEDIQEILENVTEAQFSRARPAVVHFFDHQKAVVELARIVRIHRWVVADIEETDTRPRVSAQANAAIKIVAGVSTSLMKEIVFRESQLLPHQPLWSDGSPLFAAYRADGSDRFDLVGGNVVETTKSLVDDVSSAVDRLAELNRSYDSDERLLVFCPKPLERKLIRAAAKAKISCRVFGLRGYDHALSWILMRPAPACSLNIGSPSFPMQVKGTKIVVGARFVIWINNPRLTVCVAPKLD